MSSDKLTQKELKAPDAFQKAGVEAGGWLQENQRTVALVVASVLAVGVLAAIVSYLGTRSEKSSSQDLGLALKDIDRPVAEADPEKAPAPEPGEDAPFKSEKEKDEVLHASLAKYRQSGPKGAAASTAALAFGQVSYRLGKHDEALAAFEEFLKGSLPDDPLRASALEGQGYAHEAKGALDQALTSFEALGREKTEFLAGMGTYHQARILQAQGKLQDSVRKLQEVNASNPGSAAARLAAERLSVLMASGAVQAPPPPAATADAG